MYTCIHTYIQTYTHTDIHTYMHIYMYMYIMRIAPLYRFMHHRITPRRAVPHDTRWDRSKTCPDSSHPNSNFVTAPGSNLTTDPRTYPDPEPNPYQEHRYPILAHPTPTVQAITNRSIPHLVAARHAVQHHITSRGVTLHPSHHTMSSHAISCTKTNMYHLMVRATACNHVIVLL